jgi:hypothetical protein
VFDATRYFRRHGEMQDTPEAYIGGKVVSDPILEAVLQLLCHLERQLQWWRGLGLLVMAILGLVVLGA